MVTLQEEKSGPPPETLEAGKDDVPTEAPPDEIYDVTIIGAGPSGLYGSFYAGMREMKTLIIDSLPQAGGQLTALYPEKFIYDAPGIPCILARDLVEQLLTQARRWGPAIRLGETVQTLDRMPDNLWRLASDKGVYFTKTVVISAGVGAFVPNRLDVPGETELEGKGVCYYVRDLSTIEGKHVMVVGGGDAAVDWALMASKHARSVVLAHRRPDFRAHESSLHELHASNVHKLTPYVTRAVLGTEQVTGMRLYHIERQEEVEHPTDVVIVAIGFKADIGPIKNWGLLLDKRGIVVNQRMETNLMGVYAAGDIAAQEAKLNLITMGYAQAAMAVNVAKHYIEPKAGIFPGHSSEKMQSAAPPVAEPAGAAEPVFANPG